MVEKKQKFAKIIGKGQIEHCLNKSSRYKFQNDESTRPHHNGRSNTIGHIENGQSVLFDNTISSSDCTIFELEILQNFKYKLKSV